MDPSDFPKVVTSHASASRNSKRPPSSGAASSSLPPPVSGVVFLGTQIKFHSSNDSKWHNWLGVRQNVWNP